MSTLPGQGCGLGGAVEGDTAVWDCQVFAVALARLVEHNDGTDAQVMLKALVAATCRKYQIGEDALDVLQSTWEEILKKAQSHQTYPSIARQVRNIVRNEAVDIVRTRIKSRKVVEQVDHHLRAIGAHVDEDIASDDSIDIDEELAALLQRLREEHDRQYDAVNLARQSSSHEEARLKYEQLRNTTITPENFRQLHSRGTKRLRRYWEQSND